VIANINHEASIIELNNIGEPNPDQLQEDMSQTTHNRVFNHFAVSVTDVKATVDWYTKVERPIAENARDTRKLTM
jgi:hypothetical protein